VVKRFFLQSYFTAEKEHIFSNVAVLIFVFDVKSVEVDTDIETYQNCISNLREYSPGAQVFVLIHKMDLINDKTQREAIFLEKEDFLKQLSLPFRIQCFPTSIWEETLYKAWSRIVYSLIPNAERIREYLERFMVISEVEEVVLFEKATFLDIAHVTQPRSLDKYKDGQRFERISNIIKMFKLSCKKTGMTLEKMRVTNSEFEAFIYEFTSNTYIMVIVSDPEVRTAATLLNITNSKEHFETLLQSL